jgi:CheW-like domain
MEPVRAELDHIRPPIRVQVRPGCTDTFDSDRLSAHSLRATGQTRFSTAKDRSMSTNRAATPARAPAKSAAISATTTLREFLAFKLGAEEYGIDILRVQEIRSYEEPTGIANAPAFIKGVVDLRGVIVPIVDMRMRFNLELVNYDSSTVVILGRRCDI